MYTNYGNIPLALAVWLAADDGYDLKSAPNVFSATTLLKPTRSVILSRRLQMKDEQGTVDISDLVPARLGTAVHTATEVAWLDSRDKALRNLGVPDEVIDRICLNPDPKWGWHNDPEKICIFMEMRSQKEIEGCWVSGKFDFVEKGRVMDIKTTKTYTWIAGDKMDDYIKQGSIYRWLNPEIITDDFMDVMFVFTDWSPLQAQANKDYPQKRVIIKTLPLMDITETELFVRERLQELKRYQDTPQEELPLCTPQELWMNPSKWAFYKDATKTARATKLFDTRQEAITASQGHPNPLVVERVSEPKFCRYCAARPGCTQAEDYVNKGILKL